MVRRGEHEIKPLVVKILGIERFVWRRDYALFG
jgi:hypothetical protein